MNALKIMTALSHRQLYWVLSWLDLLEPVSSLGEIFCCFHLQEFKLTFKLTYPLRCFITLYFINLTSYWTAIL
jgi:hypothetical protein